ncbi:MAG: hypothetical protein WC213_00775 [Arenimonas sp.]|jgi:hypothetical protein
MKQLRTLLIDCRIELRKLVREFHKTELCERLDVAVQSLANAEGVELDLKSTPTPTTVREIKETSNQVALAWQMAARDLKFSNPALYDAMSKKVMTRLGAKTLVDQVDELKQLEDAAEELKKQTASAEKSREAMEAERDTLLGALASAVPELADGGDRLGVALARIEWLKSQMSKGGQRSTASVVNEEENRVPSPEILAVVAAGTRKFTNAQREWCVGEAMVLSGFQLTPMELIEQGDAKIAKIITEAQHKH